MTVRNLPSSHEKKLIARALPRHKYDEVRADPCTEAEPTHVTRTRVE